jgi:hypothetical protein
MKVITRIPEISSSIELIWVIHLKDHQLAAHLSPTFMLDEHKNLGKRAENLDALGRELAGNRCKPHNNPETNGLIPGELEHTCERSCGFPREIESVPCNV